MHNETSISIKVDLEVSTREDALRVGNRLSKMIARDAVIKKIVSKNWMLEEVYEVNLSLEPIGVAKEVYKKILSRLGDGWRTVNPQRTIWNRGERSRFAVKKVRWAQVELLDFFREKV